MAKAFAYIANSTSQTITGGGVVNLGAAQHGFGCNRCGGKAIQISECGYYAVMVGATVSDTAIGDVTLSLYQDGQLIASGTETIAAANDPASIAFPAGIKVNCNSVLTLVATATAGNPIVTNVYTTILKA